MSPLPHLFGFTSTDNGHHGDAHLVRSHDPPGQCFCAVQKNGPDIARFECFTDLRYGSRLILLHRRDRHLPPKDDIRRTSRHSVSKN